MDIQIKMSKDFETEIDRLKREYGEDFEYLNGFHDSQMNFSDFIEGFIDKNVADVTIDANANASNKDIRSLLNEKGKSHDKMFAFNKIFYELKKKYGLLTARMWLDQEYSGGFYLHDAPSTTYLPYCYAYDLSRLATEGLFFLKNYNNQPPKHLTTFIDDVIEYISFESNRSSGATGCPNILIWTYYFWKKDCESGHFIKSPEYYIKQTFQKLIYRLNQPFMRIDQTAFVNFSIFDRNYIEALFGGMQYPDGTYAIDCVEELIEHQKIFMETVSEIRRENLFTFPILTYSLLYKDGKFVDEEFAKWCSDHNTEWNDSNFFVSGDVGTLSNCPLSGDTEIIYWSEYYKEFKIGKIKDLYSRSETVNVLSCGKEVECKINKFDIPTEYEIELVNGAKFRTTANHLNKVYGKDYVSTDSLTTEDYLPYTLKPFEQNKNLSYEEGMLVGMFLGDGSYYNSNGVTFSLNAETSKDEIAFLHEYCTSKFGAKINENVLTSSISGKKSCVNVCVISDYLRGLINQFVVGGCALDKAINLKALSCSLEFRRGIIDGLYVTDGGNNNRIYTSSEALRDSMIAVFASMGIVTTVNEDNRDGRLGTHTNYTVRWYTPNGRTYTSGIYIIDDDFFWVKIKEIRKLPALSTVSYCLEVLDDSEPIFMLANGVHTHNCRLLSDTSKLNAFINSIGGTALSIGSIKVNTINLMRIALEHPADEDGYLAELRERTELCCKTLDVVRHIITRNIEKGLLPNYQEGSVELDKQYCTVGILGMFEVIEAFGYTTTDEFGYISYTDDGIRFASKIFDVLNDVKDNFPADYSFNIESVPAERAAVILCQKDNILYGLKEKALYSNQWYSLSSKCSIQERLRVSSVLDAKCSGGAILHINLDSNFPTTDAAWDMLNHIAKSGVIYFAFNTRINECKNHHGFVGTDHCPECGEPVADTYQRIVGLD